MLLKWGGNADIIIWNDSLTMALIGKHVHHVYDQRGCRFDDSLTHKCNWRRITMSPRYQWQVGSGICVLRIL